MFVPTLAILPWSIAESRRQRSPRLEPDWHSDLGSQPDSMHERAMPIQFEAVIRAGGLNRKAS